MTTSNVLRLDDYRARRDHRLRLARSLYRIDAGRSELLDHLARLAAIVGADRVATVWIDEYGPGMVHPHVILDLLCDRPRRAFGAEPLRSAWDHGVPGVQETTCSAGDATAPWTLAVALGSDGTRSWFLVADSVAPRPNVTEEQRDQVMFFAGECSAVVLHRDLDALVHPQGEDAKRTGPRFAGWPILRDVEGREDDEAESRRIALRFAVVRLPRLLLEDDLALPLDRRRQQVERARDEIRSDEVAGDFGGEKAYWDEVLRAFEADDLEGLGAALLALGEFVDGQNHLHGALELYRTAYEIFVATGQAASAVEAARFTGRAQRRMAEWDEAHRWYGVARHIAEAVSLPGKVAQVLEGVANIHRERGNLPASKAALMEAMPFAECSGDATALGGVYHALLSTDHVSGNLKDALAWGWKAVQTYDTSANRVRGLASLGGALIDAGEFDAAADAWACVARLTEDDFYRLYALDALGHLAALKRDRSAFARWAAAADALGWEKGPAAAKAEILYYRGLSYRLLGETERARAFLRRAVGFAEEHGFSQTLFQAEQALAALDTDAGDAQPPQNIPSVAPRDVRAGLRELRIDVAGEGEVLAGIPSLVG